MFIRLASVIIVSFIFTASVFAQPFAYVTNADSGNVSVIDTATNILVATIPVGNIPINLAITPDGTRVYVANGSSDNVSVIDTATNILVATIPVGADPSGVVITPDGTRVYVANGSSDNVSVIDTATNILVATIPVGAGPSGVAITPIVERAIPTLSEWGLIAMAGILGIVGFMVIRRRKALA